ncbi:MAG: CDP-glycerol glycerophosphotransferase family protein [Micropruina sp.]|uniref:CDP-glycerol glycerophosphotransferase family protein n=1 Tax=Micropruina sp. TaxID=2737536 RepID=UPI0039E52AB6
MPPSPAARFTFAKGNAAKLAALPRYAVGSVRSRFVRRDPRLWVFGSAFGLADGALALLRAARRIDPELRLVWLVGNAEQARRARALGLESAAKDSSAGFDLTASAGVIAVTHGFGDVNRYALSGATIAQLWHGSPMKKLHADSPAALSLGPLNRFGLARAAIREAYRRGTRRISLLPVAADVFVPFMCSAFDLAPRQVRVLGEPRTDVLFRGSPAGRRAAARELLERRVPGLVGRRAILYAPTWRDGEPDPGVPTERQWRRIDAFCAATDSVLLVRPHPLGVGSYSHSSRHVRLIPPSVLPESMPLLWGVDTLITDYSSMAFDYAVTGGPMLFLAPDLEHYASTRGLYLDYPTVTGGRWEQDWDGVLDVLELLDADATARRRAEENSAALAALAHRHTDGRNAERVARHLLDVTAS